jgi:hypothetical protein
MPTSTRASRRGSPTSVPRSTAPAVSVRSAPVNPSEEPLPRDDTERVPRSRAPSSHPEAEHEPPQNPSRDARTAAPDEMSVLSAYVASLANELAAVQAVLKDSQERELRLREEVTSLRNAVTDLDSVVMRELVRDLPVTADNLSSKKKSKKSSTKRGDAPNRHKTKTSKDGSSSSEEDTSEDEEEVSGSTMAQDLPRGRRVPGLVELTTRRPQGRS